MDVHSIPIMNKHIPNSSTYPPLIVSDSMILMYPAIAPSTQIRIMPTDINYVDWCVFRLPIFRDRVNAIISLQNNVIIYLYIKRRGLVKSLIEV